MTMRFQLEGRAIFFVTNNVNKFNEARRVLAEQRIAVGMLRMKSLEIQSDSLKEIAESSVRDAYRKIRLPIIVEDAGLFVEALNGFPGPYAAYVYKTIGNSGLLRLMEKVDDRAAEFQSVMAYLSKDLESPTCFDGRIRGEIAQTEKMSSNNSGFGFDPIFKPEGSECTFAEMSTNEKNRFSHRATALRKFAEWYKTLSQEQR
jgi:XTP/dITP diphosphohydrolase